jgi:hypothetical protein
MCWTVKDAHPGVVFAFWPPDIYRAISDDVEVLLD